MAASLFPWHHPRYGHAPAATIEIPVGKRMKLLGAGGHRIRSLIAETGATIRTISDDHISIFAPTREAMDDVTERVEAIFNEKSNEVG